MTSALKNSQQTSVYAQELTPRGLMLREKKCLLRRAGREELKEIEERQTLGLDVALLGGLKGYDLEVELGYRGSEVEVFKAGDGALDL